MAVGAIRIMAPSTASARTTAAAALQDIDENLLLHAFEKHRIDRALPLRRDDQRRQDQGVLDFAGRDGARREPHGRDERGGGNERDGGEAGDAGIDALEGEKNGAQAVACWPERA